MKSILVDLGVHKKNGICPLRQIPIIIFPFFYKLLNYDKKEIKTSFQNHE